MKETIASKTGTMESDVDHTDDRETRTEGNDQPEHANWRALFGFTERSHLPILLCAIMFSLASGIVIPALAVFLGKLFDVFTTFGVGEISGLDLLKKVSTYGIALAGLGSASGVLNAFYLGFWLLFGELQAKSAREKLFDGMVEKDMEWYDMRKAGIDTLISRQQTYAITCTWTNGAFY